MDTSTNNLGDLKVSKDEILKMLLKKFLLKKNL